MIDSYDGFMMTNIIKDLERKKEEKILSKIYKKTIKILEKEGFSAVISDAYEKYVDKVLTN